MGFDVNPILPLLVLDVSREKQITRMAVFTSASTPIPTATLTPEYDPCAPENLPDEVNKVHRIMREFDDTALLASNTPWISLTQPFWNFNVSVVKQKT